MPAKILSRRGSIVKVLDKRSGREKWGFVKTLGGKKERCSGFGSRKDAEDALDALIHRHHMARLGMPVTSVGVTLRELADLYLSDAADRGVSPNVIANTRRTLQRLIEILPEGVKLTALTADDLRRYRALRLEQKRHPHTIKFELKRLRTVLLSVRRLFEIKWDPPVMPEIKAVHQGRKTTLSHGQITELLAKSEGPINDFITLGLHTACRAREILNLTRRQVDFTQGIDSAYGRLRLIGKSRREDTLPLTAQAAAILSRRLGEGKKPEDRVFEESYHAVRRAFKAACKDAGIGYGQNGGVVIHTLRHSAASYLANLGVPVHILKMITRHSSAHALMIYTHASAKEVGEAIGKLGEISE